MGRTTELILRSVPAWCQLGATLGEHWKTALWIAFGGGIELVAGHQSWTPLPAVRALLVPNLSQSSDSV